MIKQNQYHKELKRLMDELAQFIYDITQLFPSDERFGLISQMRRTALSIVLNYIEGYARQRKLILKNFLEISYGSLKELKYLLYFSYKRNYLKEQDYKNGEQLTDRIGKMLWGIFTKLD